MKRSYLQLWMQQLYTTGDRARTVFGSRAFCHAAPTTWNSLPADLTDNFEFWLADVVLVVVVVIALLLSSVVQVEEVCYSATAARLSHRSCVSDGYDSCTDVLRSVVWHIWYAAGDVSLVSVQEPTVTRTQLGKYRMDWTTSTDIAVVVVVIARPAALLLSSIVQVKESATAARLSHSWQSILAGSKQSTLLTKTQSLGFGSSAYASKRCS